MQISIYSLSRRRMMLVAGAVFVLFSGFFAAQAYADNGDTARDGRLVTFHDRGSERVVLTHARTVRDALKEAKITVATEDGVEPRIDSELVATDYTINIYRARPVVIVDGAVRQKIMTAAQTVQSIAAAADITLNPEDKTKLAPSQDIAADGASMVLTIERATAFTLRLYGTSSTVYTRAATVGDMLRQKNITLAPNDTLSVAESAPLTAGMVVEVWRDGKQMATVEESINFPVRKIQDADREVGYKQVKTPGVKGKKNVTYEIDMRNGKEVGRKAVQSVVLTEPKEQVEVVGAKPSFSGDFAAALAKLRSCESGGNYANKNNSLYRGAYQFGYGTWANKYGIRDPADASPAQQDQAARELYQRRGWQPWPACSKKLQLPDVYR